MVRKYRRYPAYWAASRRWGQLMTPARGRKSCAGMELPGTLCRLSVEAEASTSHSPASEPRHDSATA